MVKPQELTFPSKEKKKRGGGESIALEDIRCQYSVATLVWSS